MAYCDADDVRVYARHPDLASEAFATQIAHVQGEMDSRLEARFDTPLWTTPAETDQLIRNVCAKWAAGLELLALYGQANDESKYADRLITEAQDTLDEVIANPSLVSAPLRETTVEDEQKSSIMISHDEPGVFDMGDPRQWGK